MKAKYILISFLLFFIVLALSGCNHPKEVIYDDFSHGIDPSIWTVINKKWGKNNNGVIWQNVGYTANGQLVLNAHGDYYQGDILGFNKQDGKRAGAAICTKKTLGPGRYEVKAKLLPRFGACCAFWTYALVGEINSEIDIEFGINNDFSHVMFTNWYTEKKYANKKTILDTYHNDDKWHTYRFDWYTYPQRKIDYYIDNRLIHTATTYIPDVAANFWIGVWFPHKWAGEPNFDSDFMLVDWFKYTSFNNNPFVVNNKEKTCPTEFYPTNTTIPKRNIISNNNFTNLCGWQANGNVVLNDKKIFINNGSISQEINHIFPNFKYTLTLDYHGKNTNVSFKCLDKNGQDLETIKYNLPEVLMITSYNCNIDLPKDTNSFIISISSNSAVIAKPNLDFRN